MRHCTSKRKIMHTTEPIRACTKGSRETDAEKTFKSSMVSLGSEKPATRTEMGWKDGHMLHILQAPASLRMTSFRNRPHCRVKHRNFWVNGWRNPKPKRLMRMLKMEKLRQYLMRYQLFWYNRTS